MEVFLEKSVALHLFEGPVHEHYLLRDWGGEKKKKKPRIQTHDLLIGRHVLYCCATTTALKLGGSVCSLDWFRIPVETSEGLIIFSPSSCQRKRWFPSLAHTVEIFWRARSFFSALYFLWPLECIDTQSAARLDWTNADACNLHAIRESVGSWLSVNAFNW